MIQAFEAGEHQLAATILQRTLPVIKALFKHPNPVVVKYALSKIGVEVGPLRLPLVDMTATEKEEFDAVWGQYLQFKK